MSAYIRLISADSKMFQRGAFSAPIGVALCYSDLIGFDSLYDEIVNELFEKYSLERYKNVFSSTDISRLFGKNRKEFIDFLENFVIKIITEGKLNLNVVYTTLSISELPDGVTLYGTERFPSKNIPVPEFLRLLSQYYPYICAWIVSKRAQFHGRLVYLDNIQGEVTNAWNELISSQVVSIFPSGDLVCKEVSASDLCVRYVDDMLYVKKRGLRREDIESIFDEIGIKVITHYVGHEDLDSIRPIEKRPILSEGLFASPMVYILKEQIMEKEMEYLKARPELMSKIENYAYENKGGLKFIDYTQDYRYLREGDHVIYLGPRGKEQADYFNRLGWNVVARSIEDLK